MASVKEKIAYALGDAAAGASYGRSCLSPFLCFSPMYSASHSLMRQY